MNDRHRNNNNTFTRKLLNYLAYEWVKLLQPPLLVTVQ